MFSDSGFDMSNVLEWSPRFDIGIPVIDDQHKRLVGLCNRLHRGLMQNGAETTWSDSLAHAIRECYDYVLLHFKTEETLMRAAGYPDYPDHKREHDMFRKKVLSLANEFETSTIGTAYKFVRFLYDWVFTHIAHEDKLFVKSVLDYYRRTRTAVAAGAAKTP